MKCCQMHLNYFNHRYANFNTQSRKTRGLPGRRSPARYNQPSRCIPTHLLQAVKKRGFSHVWLFLLKPLIEDRLVFNPVAQSTVQQLFLGECLCLCIKPRGRCCLFGRVGGDVISVPQWHHMRFPQLAGQELQPVLFSFKSHFKEVGEFRLIAVRCEWKWSGLLTVIP